MGEVVGQLEVPITPLEGVYPIWQEFCNQSEEGSLPHWTVIHWLDPPRMVSLENISNIFKYSSYIKQFKDSDRKSKPRT